MLLNLDHNWIIDRLLNIYNTFLLFIKKIKYIRLLSVRLKLKISVTTEPIRLYLGTKTTSSVLLNTSFIEQLRWRKWPSLVVSSFATYSSCYIVASLPKMAESRSFWQWYLITNSWKYKITSLLSKINCNFFVLFDFC